LAKALAEDAAASPKVWPTVGPVVSEEKPLPGGPSTTPGVAALVFTLGQPPVLAQSNAMGRTSGVRGPRVGSTADPIPAPPPPLASWASRAAPLKRKGSGPSIVARKANTKAWGADFRRINVLVRIGLPKGAKIQGQSL
jgi:hypothetical protein